MSDYAPSGMRKLLGDEWAEALSAYIAIDRPDANTVVANLELEGYSIKPKIVQGWINNVHKMEGWNDEEDQEGLTHT